MQFNLRETFDTNVVTGDFRLGYTSARPAQDYGNFRLFSNSEYVGEALEPISFVSGSVYNGAALASGNNGLFYAALGLGVLGLFLALRP